MNKRRWKAFFIVSVLIISIAISSFYSDDIINIVSNIDIYDEQFFTGNMNSWWIYPELKSGEIFVSPQFDWGKFWNVFKNHALWSLEGWNPSTEQWEFCNDSLMIDIDSVGNNGRKLTLIFDAPASVTTDYRLTLAIDYRVKQYIHQVDRYTYNLSFEVSDESFNVSYNFSDIANIPGVIITHGVKEVDGNDYFWFRARRNGVPSGYHIELDPTYTVYAGISVSLVDPSQRKIVRQSNGTLWCTFHESSDVHVAWSEDDGVTWNDYEVWGAETSTRSSLAVDSNDVVHMVFQSLKNDANDYQLEYSNSTDWTTIVQIRDEDKFHQFSSLAVDSNDNLHIVYKKGEEGTSNDDQVAYINSTDNGGSWGTEQILTDEADFGDDRGKVGIAIDSNDIIHIVFMQTDHYSNLDDILHMQSSDYGNTWTDWESDPVYQDAGHDQRQPGIVIDDNDVLHVVWTGISQNINDQIGYSYNDGGGWSDVEWVTWDPALDYRFPSVSVNDNDYIHTAMDVGFTRLNHSINDTISWTMDVALTGDYGNPNMISTQWPVIDGLKTNRPKTGYAMICSFTVSNITYHASDDLTWETPVPPVLSGVAPVNQSTDVSLEYLRTWIIVTDADDDTMTVEFFSNATGDWIRYGYNSSVSSGTNVSQFFGNATFYNTTFHWSVNCTDGSLWVNATYHFTTESRVGAGDWDYGQTLVWAVNISGGITILKLSESGNLAIAGVLYENTNSPPPGVTILVNMTDLFWLSDSGDLYIKESIFE